jgi:hypothetical protein
MKVKGKILINHFAVNTCKMLIVLLLSVVVLSTRVAVSL